MNNTTPYLKKISTQGVLLYLISLPNVWIMFLFCLIQSVLLILLPLSLIFYFVDSESYLSNYTYLTLGGILIASILFCCIYVKYRILYNIMLEIDYTVSSEFFDLFLINSLSNGNDYLKIEKVKIYCSKIFYSILKFVLVIPSLAIITFFLTWQLGLIFLIAIVVLSCILSMINYYLYNNNLLSEKITHDDEVFQIHQNDKYFHEKILDILRIKYSTLLNFNLKAIHARAILDMGLFVAIFISSFYIFSLNQHNFNILNVTTFLFLTFLLIHFLKPLIELPAILKNSEKLKIIINKLLLNQNKENIEIKTLDSCASQLIFNNVSAGYSHSKNVLINNLSFVANKGNVFLIHGISGTGKTSIMKLILNQFQPLSGTISIKDQENEHDNKQFIKNIYYISPSSIFENLNMKDNWQMNPHSNPIEDLKQFTQNLNITPTISHEGISKYTLFQLQSSFLEKDTCQKIINHLTIDKLCRPLSNKIILIDEPLISPDQSTLSYFEDIIKTLKINNIIIISSSLEIYNKLADKNITLNYPDFTMTGSIT